jgi:hypothetical protein
MANEIKPGWDGLYAVSFLNDKAYNEEKIREIFGRYGHVVSVRFWVKEGRTSVFVRYKEYNETKQCLDDLNKTNELSVRMAIPTKKFLQGAPKQQSRTYVARLVQAACLSSRHVFSVCCQSHTKH